LLCSWDNYYNHTEILKLPLLYTKADHSSKKHDIARLNGQINPHSSAYTNKYHTLKPPLITHRRLKMFSTPALGVLFTFLIMQVLTRASALPTSTTITISSARRETIQASDSNWKSNDHNGYNAILPDNSTTSK